MITSTVSVCTLDGNGPGLGLGVEALLHALLLVPVAARVGWVAESRPLTTGESYSTTTLVPIPAQFQIHNASEVDWRTQPPDSGRPSCSVD